MQDDNESVALFEARSEQPLPLTSGSAAWRQAGIGVWLIACAAATLLLALFSLASSPAHAQNRAISYELSGITAYSGRSKGRTLSGAWVYIKGAAVGGRDLVGPHRVGRYAFEFFGNHERASFQSIGLSTARTVKNIPANLADRIEPTTSGNWFFIDRWSISNGRFGQLLRAMSEDDRLVVFSICSLLSREEFGAEAIKRAVELRSFDDVYKKFWTASRRLEEMQQLGRSCIAEIGKVFNPASVTKPIDAVRITRIQTALEKLGFYTRAIDGVFGPGTRAAVTAYRRSFDFPGGDGLSDAEVSNLERIARSGFRDGNELRRAEAAGFTSRSEYSAALVGGFRDARSFSEARRAGFNRRDEWERFVASGSSNPALYREALAAGFTDAQSFEGARRAGFTVPDEYAAFIASGLPDRTAFLSDRERREEVEALSGTCNAATEKQDWILAAPACRRASIAVPDDSALATAAATAEQRLEVLEGVARADLARLQSNLADARAAVAANPSPDASRWLDAVTVETAAARDLLLRAGKATAVASCIVESDAGRWTTALDACSIALAAAPSDQFLTARLETAREQGSEEEASARLALETARSEASRLSATLEAFTRSGGVLERGLDIARAVVAMRELETRNAFEPLDQALGALTSLLSEEPAYNASLMEEASAASLAQTEALAEALDNARRLEAFIRNFLARNVLAQEAPMLLAQQERLVEALEANNDEMVIPAQEEATRVLGQLGLDDQARAFFLGPDPDSETSRQAAAPVDVSPGFTPVPRPNALAVVIGNRNYSEAPEVRFAHNDASAFARFFTDVMGLEPRKVIHENDLTSVGMARLFGRPGGPDGRIQRLSRFVDEVYVFYSGHGVPELRPGSTARGYILPVDIPPGTPGFGAYALDDLISQLQDLPVSRVTVFIDACFSGLSEGGSLIANVSGAFGVAVTAPARLARVSVLAATAFDEPQLAHWLPEREHGAFTFHALTGLHGAADRMGDRRVTLTALRSFIDEGLAFGGFDQRPSLIDGNDDDDDPVMDFSAADVLPRFGPANVIR